MPNHDCDGSFGAFLFGGLLGAAIALLLAPKTGEETREQIADWLEEGRRRTRDYLDEATAPDA
ncbi:MAG: hypothetical protein AUJ52_08815 [Elusimicrobia bacterium CG1_02_63_36]|nr:MAG: hypothetical protein AUJ52_08815 [Elusimicrobia bacterium CG1_02_63_36]PIP84624.1 MAG: hypothetical protein COR54_03150 [Elusimicrobia bacterium CG22_combo_CG10-13_8_21_14_all_63_91]PJA12434.1 MAG: hypothetical protein COX66_17415 [Elusimicrobia bacterium CG_4_10_14_0_2_um_filter_63_34]PJB22917.1 MAG: hypothetical protein CO113_19875 [Elusimicrobia bacterium CG_4_9_14_3_um_filter_62_55]